MKMRAALRVCHLTTPSSLPPSFTLSFLHQYHNHQQQQLLLRTYSSSSPCFMPSMTVNVPKMGDSITEGTVSKILVKAGDAVVIDQVIAVIDTDKVAVDIRSPEGGVFELFHVKLDDTISVGAPLFTINTSTNAAAAAAAPASSPAPSPSPASSSIKAAPAPAVTAPAAPNSHLHQQQHGRRVPSIAFRYGTRPPSTSSSAASNSAAPSNAVIGYLETLRAQFPSKSSARDFLSAPPLFGRPAFATHESFVINSGGCLPDPEPTKGKKK